MRVVRVCIEMIVALALGTAVSAVWADMPALGIKLRDMKRRKVPIVVAAVVIAVLVPTISVYADQPNLSSGVGQNSGSNSSSIDSVDLQTGRLIIHLPLPILSPQRGGHLSVGFSLIGNAPVWSVVTQDQGPFSTFCQNVTDSTTGCWMPNFGSRNTNLGNFANGLSDTTQLEWSLDVQFNRQIVTEFTTTQTVLSANESNHFLTTPDGGNHHLQDISSAGDGSQWMTIDGTGYEVFLGNKDTHGIYTSGTIVDRTGNRYTLNLDRTYGCSGSPKTGETICADVLRATQIEDVNGNLYTLMNPNSGVLEAGSDTKGIAIPTQVTPGIASTACPGGTGASSFPVSYLGYQGSLQTITECYAHFAISTGFGQPGIAEYSKTNGATLLTAAIMPDGLKYTFSYDSYGNLTAVGLPQGGTITYTWVTNNFALGNCGNAAQYSRGVQTRTLNDANGHSYIWNYRYTPLSSSGTITNTVTDPNRNDTDVVFSAYSTPQGGSVTGATACSGLVQTATRVYKGTGNARTLLAETDVQYQAQAMKADVESATDSTPIVGNIYATTSTTTNAVAGLTKKVVRTPDTGLGSGKPFFGQTLKELVYDWGVGTPGPMVKETDSAFQWQIDSRFLAADILDLPASVVVKDGRGNKTGETDYTYDGSVNLVASGVTTQHVAAPNPVRGNITTIARWLNTRTGSAVTKPFNFYDTGERVDDIQPANWNADHRTEFRYDATGTYVTEVDMPSTNNSVIAGLPTVAHIAKTQYDFDTGLVTSATDESGNVTTFGYDNMGRRAYQINSDGGQATFNYNALGAVLPNLETDVFPGTIDSTSNLSTLTNITDTDVTYDGLGRPIRTRKLLSTTGSGTSANYVRATVDVVFDAFSRPLSTTSPYLTTSDTTYGVTQSQYDALGRVVNVTQADNSVVTNTYDLALPGVAGLCSKVQDEAGKRREACTDALGRPTAVIEDPDGLPLETDYAYSTVENDPTAANGSQKTTVTQKGRPGNAGSAYRVRTSVYDSLGRLLSATNPETGTLGYSYDDNGNVLSKIDARGVVANYTYDQENRLELLSFQNAPAGTANGCWIYDVSSFPNMGSFYNPVGRLVVSSEGCGTVFNGYSYDSMGRVTSHLQCAGDANSNPTGCGDQAVTYNYLGDMTSLEYQNFYNLKYTYDESGRVLSAIDGNGYVYANNIGYTASGAVTGISTPTFGYNYVYNKRFQLSQLAIGSTAASLLVKDYNYNPGSDNGNVISVTDENDGRRSQAFGYDALNRLTCAQAGVTSLSSSCTGTGAWGDSYQYDDFGNLTAKTATQGVGEQIAMTVDATTNRIKTAAGKTYTYDLAGNIINDGTRAYTFDASNRLLSAGNMHYTYGPGGERITKSDGTTYFYGPGGQLLTTFNPDGSQSNYVYLGGVRLARIQWAGSNSIATSDIKYYLSDALGSTDKFVDKDGKTIVADQDFFPFGGTVPGVGKASNSNHFLFTAEERDPESGLDYFGARYYNNVVGRWISADWSAGPSAIPYANFTAPQSMNLYSYAGNNPSSTRDVDGHFLLSRVVEPFECYVCDTSPEGEDGGEDLGDEPDIVDVNVGPCTLCASSSDGGTEPVPDLQIDSLTLSWSTYQATLFLPDEKKDIHLGAVETIPTIMLPDNVLISCTCDMKAPLRGQDYVNAGLLALTGPGMAGLWNADLDFIGDYAKAALAAGTFAAEFAPASAVENYTTTYIGKVGDLQEMGLLDAAGNSNEIPFTNVLGNTGYSGAMQDAFINGAMESTANGGGIMAINPGAATGTFAQELQTLFGAGFVPY